MNKKTLLIEGITKDIVAYLMQDNHMDLPSAVSLFHNSETFEKLSDESPDSILKLPPMSMKC